MSGIGAMAGLGISVSESGAAKLSPDGAPDFEYEGDLLTDLQSQAAPVVESLESEGISISGYVENLLSDINNLAKSPDIATLTVPAESEDTLLIRLDMVNDGDGTDLYLLPEQDRSYAIKYRYGEEAGIVTSPTGSSTADVKTNSWCVKTGWCDCTSGSCTFERDKYEEYYCDDGTTFWTRTGCCDGGWC